MAVGVLQTVGGQNPFSERWDGSRWTLATVPLPTGAVSAALSAVSCSSANACTAVGAVSFVAYTSVPLVERWNGSSWTIQRIPGPKPSQSWLWGVSCASRTACTAVGADVDYAHPVTQWSALVERWNGMRWQVEPFPRPLGTYSSVLYAVSCITPTVCNATGATDAETFLATTRRIPAPKRHRPPRVAYYLALGDSAAMWNGDRSYPDLILARYRRQVPGLSLVDIAQSNATTGSMLDRGQYAQALSFLHAHKHHVALITIDIGGNDIVFCASPSGIDEQCAARARAMIKRNLTTILAGLHHAAPRVPVIGMSYYDPFLGYWLNGGSLRQLALATVPDLVKLNRELASLYGAKHTADVQDAYRSTNVTTIVSSPWGNVPIAVQRACSWLDITCQPGGLASFGDDPTTTGAVVIAAAFERTIGRTLRPSY